MRSQACGSGSSLLYLQAHTQGQKDSFVSKGTCHQAWIQSPNLQYKERHDFNKCSLTSTLSLWLTHTHRHRRHGHTYRHTQTTTKKSYGQGSCHPADIWTSPSTLPCAGRLVSNGPAAPLCSRVSLAGCPNPLLLSLWGDSSKYNLEITASYKPSVPVWTLTRPLKLLFRLEHSFLPGVHPSLTLSSQPFFSFCLILA